VEADGTVAIVLGGVLLFVVIAGPLFGAESRPAWQNVDRKPSFRMVGSMRPKTGRLPSSNADLGRLSWRDRLPPQPGGFEGFGLTQQVLIVDIRQRRPASGGAGTGPPCGPSTSCGIVPQVSDEAMHDKLALHSPAAAFFLFGTGGLDWFFLNLLNRHTTIQIRAEHFDYTTTTEILATAPDGEGGLALMLDATVDRGELVVTEAMMAGAEYDGDFWYIRHAGLVFRFGAGEAEPAFGRDRFFTQDAEAWEEHRRYMEEREVRREAQRAEQGDRWLGFGVRDH
jgi:hypothetical protein